MLKIQPTSAAGYCYQLGKKELANRNAHVGEGGNYYTRIEIRPHSVEYTDMNQKMNVYRTGVHY